MTRRLIRSLLRRQQRIAYFLIAFLLLAPADVFAKSYGLTAVLTLWAGFIVLLELGYRRLMLLEARHRRQWWAKQHDPRKSSIRFYTYAVVMAILLIFNSQFTRYALLSLLAAGLVCAGVIRLLNRGEEI